MDWKGLFKEWRIIVLLLAVAGSIVAIGPHYEQGENGRVVIATNIKKGFDFKGGHRILLAPKNRSEEFKSSDITATKQVLQNRISAFGLQQMQINPTSVSGKNFIQVKASGIDKTDLQQLIERQGRFEAKIPIEIGASRQLSFYGTDFNFSQSNEALTVSWQGKTSTYSLGDSFKLPGIEHNITFAYDYINKSRNKTGVVTTAFTGQDIIQVYTSSNKATVTPSTRGSGYNFRFQVSIEKRTARNFKQIAHNLECRGENLESNLNLYLDNNLTDSLGIGCEFRNEIVTTPSITGGAGTEKEARRQMFQLQSILRSGRLPVKLETVSTHETSQAMGKEKFRLALIAILLTVPVVTFIIFLRYRRLEIVLPIAITGFSEVLLIFGLASAIGWTIDLTAIAGIIAALGSGVDDQLIITDESSTQKIKSLKKKIKRAFFIIFTAAASTIGVMLPLGFMFAGFIKGFAITTMLGDVIGVTITRPAYAKIIEYLD